MLSRCVCGIVAVDDPAWKSDKDFGRAALVRAANWDRMLAGDPPMKSSNEVFFQVQVCCVAGWCVLYTVCRYAGCCLMHYIYCIICAGCWVYALYCVLYA